VKSPRAGAVGQVTPLDSLEKYLRTSSHPFDWAAAMRNLIQRVEEPVVVARSSSM